MSSSQGSTPVSFALLEKVSHIKSPDPYTTLVNSPSGTTGGVQSMAQESISSVIQFHWKPAAAHQHWFCMIVV